jgi:hypothetical protein
VCEQRRKEEQQKLQQEQRRKEEEQRRKEEQQQKLLLQKRNELEREKRGNLDTAVSEYHSVRRQRSDSGLQLSPQWDSWLVVLQIFLNNPPPDLWLLADCDAILKLEQDMEQAFSQLEVRDRLRAELVTKVQSLVKFEQGTQLRDWDSLLAQQLGDVGEEKTGQTTQLLVETALAEYQSWLDSCSGQLSGVCLFTDDAFSELATVVSKLSVILTASLEFTGDLQVGPK